MLKVKDVYGWVDEIAPFDKAESWDNVGLLCGSMENEVQAIFCALELNDEVLDAALEKGCSLIVTHHPILFGGRKNLCEDTAEGRLLCRLGRAHMNLIAAHTNYDVAAGGVNDCLAEALGLTNVQCVDGDEEAILRIGDVEPMTAAAFAARVTERLGDVVRVYGDRQKTVRRVALVGGAGGEYAQTALKAGADVYVTGEMRYHDAVSLAAEGLVTMQAGHDSTEQIAVKPLRNGLQMRANALQYNVKVYANDLGVEE